MTHQTVVLDDPFSGEPVDVDELLVPLVRLLWEAGIETTASCQDAGDAPPDLLEELPHLQTEVASRRGRAYVDFVNDLAAAAFFDAVAGAGPRDDLYVRMVHWAAPGAWQVRLSLEDLALDDPDAESDFVPGAVQVLFPQGDITPLVERLQRHVRGETTPPGPVDWSSLDGP